MYGNLNAALQFLNKYIGMLMNDLGFSQSNLDPCIFYKLDGNGKLVIHIYAY